jgi:hypothetical protein
MMIQVLLEGGQSQQETAQSEQSPFLQGIFLSPKFTKIKAVFSLTPNKNH